MFRTRWRKRNPHRYVTDWEARLYGRAASPVSLKTTQGAPGALQFPPKAAERHKAKHAERAPLKPALESAAASYATFERISDCTVLSASPERMSPPGECRPGDAWQPGWKPGPKGACVKKQTLVFDGFEAEDVRIYQAMTQEERDAVWEMFYGQGKSEGGGQGSGVKRERSEKELNPE